MSDTDEKTTVQEGEDLKLIKSLITAHQDFPLPGILFRDVFPVFRDPVATSMLLNRLQARIQNTYGKVDAIIGLDSRGFLIGPPLALALGCKFIPIRKHGKLPGDCLTVSYAKEYGEDKFDIQKASVTKGDKCIIVDDLLATGGTLNAAVSLTRQTGGVVTECIVIIELDELQGRKKYDAPTWSLVHY